MSNTDNAKPISPVQFFGREGDFSVDFSPRVVKLDDVQDPTPEELAALAQIENELTVDPDKASEIEGETAVIGTEESDIPPGPDGTASDPAPSASPISDESDTSSPDDPLPTDGELSVAVKTGKGPAPA